MKLRIKEYRNKKRMTLSELSRISGYNRSYLNLLENNKKNPTLTAFESIAFALETCPKKLIGGCDHLDCSNCKLDNYNLIEMFYKLDEKNKNLLIKFMKVLLEE